MNVCFLPAFMHLSEFEKDIQFPTVNQGHGWLSLHTNTGSTITQVYKEESDSTHTSF